MAKRVSKKPRSKDDLENNPSKRERPPKLEPELLKEAPPAPDYLDGDKAIELWEALAPQLVELSVLAELDLPALAVLCNEWQAYIELGKVAADPKKRIVRAKSGYPVEHPAVRLRQTAVKNLASLWRQFGLTPLTRENLDVDLAANNADSLAAYAERRGT